MNSRVFENLMGTQVKPLDCAWAHKTLSQPITLFIACRCHLGLRIQFTPASKETGGIFEKIVAGVTGLELATSCVTGNWTTYFLIKTPVFSGVTCCNKVKFVTKCVTNITSILHLSKE